MDYHSEDSDCVHALRIISSSTLPMVLKTAIELDLLELIKKSGSNASASASASELVAQLSTKNPDAATMVDRILALLAAHSVLNCTVKTLPDGATERRYSVSPVGMFFTKNEDGVSLAPLALLNTDKLSMESWYHLKDSIVEGGVPLDRAYGMSAFELSATNPKLNKVFNQAMSYHSTLFMNKILEIYKGFEGLESLVDVGGGIGTMINMIISKHPSIKGINFDLPHVISEAPSYQGVEHIGGNMLASVPKAHAIFLKWICHNWSDEHCQKLLKNCYEALPENGKLIVAEIILPDDPNIVRALPNTVQDDVIMLTYTPGGKERTEKEFQTLAYEAGFKKLSKMCCAFNIWIMEFHK